MRKHADSERVSHEVANRTLVDRITDRPDDHRAVRRSQRERILLPVKLVRAIEEKNEALRVRDIAQILGVSVQQIYKLAAKGQIPSFRIANSVRFDPQEFAGWLRDKYPSSRVSPMDRIARSA
jgi:excisionase family DNA binding protein